MLDVEVMGNCSRRPSDQELQQEVGQWLQEVEDARGVTPLIYTTLRLQQGPLAGFDNPLWLRRIGSRPPPGAWTVWQFSNHGWVRGIRGRVDENVFAGDRAAFEAWVEGEMGRS